MQKIKVYDKDGNFKDMFDISDIVIRNANDRLVVLNKEQAIIYINNQGLYIKKQFNDAKTKLVTSYNKQQYDSLMAKINSYPRKLHTFEAY